MQETTIRFESDGLQVVFDAVPIGIVEDELANVEPSIATKIRDIDSRLEKNQDHLEKKDFEIERLTNHADEIDYAVAVGCGIACGLIDSFFVGDFDWGNARKWSYQKVNQYVAKYAREHGYTGGSRRLKDKIAFLEGKYKIPSDNLYVGKDASIWTMSHHLDDFAHHPSPLGWICSVLTQFTGKACFANKEGSSFLWDVESKELIGDTIPEKFAAGTINWFGHLVSDVAGSSNTPGKAGMGLPGPIVSIAKEFSQLPGVNKTGLPKLLNDVFVKHRFDFRKELAVAHELGRQAVPVVINEVLVRLFFFLRRLVQEWRQYGFAGIHWRKTLPFMNRTIARMNTIASGTFMAIDLADASIRSGIKSWGDPATFWAEFVLKVNFVGIGRFAIACVTDVGMGVKLEHRRWERIVIVNERLLLQNAKVELKNADVWVEVDKTGKAVRELYESCESAISQYEVTMIAAQSMIKEIGTSREKIEKKNPELLSELVDFMDEL